MDSDPLRCKWLGSDAALASVVAADPEFVEVELLFADEAAFLEEAAGLGLREQAAGEDLVPGVTLLPLIPGAIARLRLTQLLALAASSTVVSVTESHTIEPLEENR